MKGLDKLIAIAYKQRHGEGVSQDDDLYEIAHEIYKECHCCAYRDISEQTCEVDGIEEDEPTLVYEVDLSCGHHFYVTNPDAVKYCEECGAKVVE